LSFIGEEPDMTAFLIEHLIHLLGGTMFVGFTWYALWRARKAAR
jgi:hypothetical protein